MMCCYYPTTTVAIDDDTDFLGILTQHLGITDCLPYSSPITAINTLNPQQPFKRIQSRILKAITPSENGEFPEDQTIHFNLRNLHEEIYNKDRFKDVSVIIVDYHMGDVSGIDVCEALSHHPARKILLTGVADKETIALEAFNKGIIHRFINKSDANFPTKLKQAISVLKEAYFRDLTSSLFPQSMNLNIHPSFVNYSRNLYDQYEAIEYYLIDSIGSTLMLDANGNAAWLLIKHKSDMMSLEELARIQEAPNYLIQSITNTSLIPFFFSDNDYQTQASEWEKICYPAQVLPGVKDYYYATWKGQQNHIEQNKIFPYNSFSTTK